MLYSEKDLKDVLKQLIIYIVLCVIVIGAGITVSYVLAFNINSTLGTFTILVTTAVCVFLFGNLVSPCFHYYKFLLEALTGRCKSMGGVVKSIGKKPVYKDNKNFYYEVDIEVAPEKYALFLYDANLGNPNFEVGKRINCMCYENYILKVNSDVKEED